MVSATGHAIAYYFKAVLVGVVLFLITAMMIDGGAEAGGLLFGAVVVLGWPFIMTVLLFNQVGSIVDDKLQERRAARAQASRNPRQNRQPNTGNQSQNRRSNTGNQPQNRRANTGNPKQNRQANTGKRRTKSDIMSSGSQDSTGRPR